MTVLLISSVTTLAPQAALVCGALVSIATHTPDSWSHATPRLMEYLEAKTNSHYQVLVRSLRHYKRVCF